jgi:excinuclease ABC subunit C
MPARRRRSDSSASPVDPAPVEVTSDTTPVPGVVAESAVTPRRHRKQVPVLTEDDLAVRPSVAELLERLPTDPGVYLMKDKRGRVIYVGKAKNLKNRVRSYFHRSGDNRPFVKLLDRILADIETVITSSEKEALLLENTLIKQHKPRFNVRLIDDKNYLVLRLDAKARFPRLEVTRKIREDGARYFGPYHSARACRQTLEVIGRHFRLRTCTDQVMNGRRRPCLEHQIKRCDAPCVLPVSPSQYAEQVRDVALFLDHKSSELLDRLRDADAGGVGQPGVRDGGGAARSAQGDRGDAGAAARGGDAVRRPGCDRLLPARRRAGDRGAADSPGQAGRAADHRCTGQEFPDEESLSSFVSQYYDRPGIEIPDEVLLPLPIEDQQAKSDWLRERTAELFGRARKVEVETPKRGPRHRLVDLANKNAAAAYASRRNRTRDTEAALGKLQRRLGLKKLPLRIECFDISHLQGSDTVASRVVFLDGEPAKHLYRTFKVRSVLNDDFAAMYEVLSRRFRRALGKETGPVEPTAEVGFSSAQVARRRAAALLPVQVPKPMPLQAPDPVDPVAPVAPEASEVADPPELDDAEMMDAQVEAALGEVADDEVDRAAAAAADPWGLPDLLVIDGGKGQLATALAALRDLGINWAAELDVIGLAKEREDASGDRKPDRVFLPRTKDPIRLRDNTAELFVLSRIRDEAHRFAVSFHHKLREKRTIRSALQEIPGIGPKRQQALLRQLGSVRRIRTASRQELLAVPGMSEAAVEAVLHFFLDRQAATVERVEVAPQVGSAAGSAAAPDVIEHAAAAELAALAGDDSEDDLARSVAAVFTVADEVDPVAEAGSGEAGLGGLAGGPVGKPAARANRASAEPRSRGPRGA